MTEKVMKVNKFRRRDVKIGMIIFLFLLIYLLAHIYTYFTKTEISIYEVQPGTIYTTAQCDGMILREEELVMTDVAGYVNYYFSEGSRISKDSTIYSIDSNRNMYELLSGNTTEIKLSGEDLSDLKQLLQEELGSISSYLDVRRAKTNVITGYQRLIDKMLMEELNQIVTSTGISSNFHVVKSQKSGIISYMMDDYTNYSIQDVTAECFKYQNTDSSLYSIDLIAANSPVYKLILSDQWKLVVLLDESLYGSLLGKETATFTLENAIKVTAPINCYRKEDAYFAEISMEKYLSNYVSERFIKITFELEEVEGLKIPESAITWKDYYRIPEDYLVQGGNESAVSKGLLIESFNPETGAALYTFEEVEIFYSADGFVYIDCLDYPKETYIIKQDQSSRVMLYTFVNKLEGAYNINKGYAAFRRIERRKTENGYVIVKNNSSSGLSAYDHIALDAATVIENAVIY